MIRLVLFGAPGCGKGTQGDLLEEKYGYKKISTGDLIRAEVKAGSETGRKVKAIMEKGELVSDEIIIEMVKNRVKQDDITLGYTMDGFPRTLEQAKALSNIPVERETAIFLKVDEEAVVERLVSRLTCKNCSAIFNTKNKAPQKEGLCDECGGKLERRKDDNEETIRSRIAVYKEQTEPAVKYYRENSTLYEVDAAGTPAEIFAKLEEIVK
ncbi:MAG: adenylate kinase [Candidatus Aminicenantes bacterium]|nr:adenylate kinase [Candidatus Aminicenantes bacterium]